MLSDIEAEFADLSRAHPGRAAYTEMDKYRDFLAVFLSDDQGRRVLYEIMTWAHCFRSSAAMARFDPSLTFFHEGERNLALKIFATARVEPTERPATQSKQSET